MPTVRVTARARGYWVSPSPLTDVVREKPCPAQELPKGRW